MTTRNLMRTVVLAVACGSMTLPATAESTPEPSSERGILDEYTLDVHGAGDSLRVGAGMLLGNVEKGGYAWAFGGRASWLQISGRGNVRNGWALGALAGLSFRPERTLSPTMSLALDRPFALGDRYDLLTTVSAGLRFRVVPAVEEHFALRFVVFRSEFVGKKGIRNEADYGVGVVYSVALYDRR